jgi:hypothetical protein
MLYQIASAYNENKKAAQVAAQPTAMPAPTATEPPATEPPAPTDVVLGPEEAARLAAQVVGNTNLLSAESSNFNGVNAYLITFTNKDVVYVGLDGQILGVQVAPVVVNVAAPAKKKNNDRNTNVRNSSGEDHERDEDEHDEHEEHED